MPEFDAVAFDAYGTLFDVLGNWAAPEVVASFRQKQLQYSWLTTLMGEYRDFREVTRAAVEYVLDQYDEPGDVELIMREQLSITPFGDVRGALERLGAGHRLGILSNGHPDSLAALVGSAGLEGTFEWVVSVHEVRLYKPSPAVYQLLLDRTGIPKERLLFVSSNGWDAAGAANYGLRVAWVNRTGAPADRVGGRPELVVADLQELAERLGA